MSVSSLTLSLPDGRKVDSQLTNEVEKVECVRLLTRNYLGYNKTKKLRQNVTCSVLR